MWMWVIVGSSERVLAADELGELLLDLGVQARIAEQARPRRVRAPPREVLGHGVDDLLVEVEAQVVARRPVGEPPVADADLAADLLVDDGIHHRMGVLEAREVGDRRHPAVEPSVVVAPAGLAIGRRFGRRDRSGAGRARRSNAGGGSRARAPSCLPHRSDADRPLRFGGTRSQGSSRSSRRRRSKGASHGFPCVRCIVASSGSITMPAIVT